MLCNLAARWLEVSSTIPTDEVASLLGQSIFNLTNIKLQGPIVLSCTLCTGHFGIHFTCWQLRLAAYCYSPADRPNFLGPDRVDLDRKIVKL